MLKCEIKPLHPSAFHLLFPSTTLTMSLSLHVVIRFSLAARPQIRARDCTVSKSKENKSPARRFVVVGSRLFQSSGWRCSQALVCSCLLVFRAHVYRSRVCRHLPSRRAGAIYTSSRKLGRSAGVARSNRCATRAQPMFQNSGGYRRFHTSA